MNWKGKYGRCGLWIANEESVRGLEVNDKSVRSMEANEESVKSLEAQD